jgi:hypothetical protein
VNEHKFERRQLTEKAKTLRTMIQYRHLRNGAISAVNGCPAYHSTKPINEMPGRSATNLGSTTSMRATANTPTRISHHLQEIVLL